MLWQVQFSRVLRKWFGGGELGWLGALFLGVADLLLAPVGWGCIMVVCGGMAVVCCEWLWRFQSLYGGFNRE